MGSSAKTEYCAFTKAVEQLGDRWSLLIIRELHMFGPQGFNTLASGLPGRISRSVLAARMRKLSELGLVARIGDGAGSSVPYQLTPAGEQLVPTLQSLWQWAEHWVPEDPAAAQREPTLVLWWLLHRVEPMALPEQQVVLQFALAIDGTNRQWLLLAAGNEPELCEEDPLIAEERYVHVDGDADALFPIARGTRSWTDAIAGRSVRLYGDPALVRRLPSWFAPPDAEPEQQQRALAAAS
jgi:DNA-binding HxlR family transcriptional regulator